MDKPTKEQLEINIKTAENWLNALNRGTFSGADAYSIAGLIGFIEQQKRISLLDYESMVPPPEFVKPPELDGRKGLSQ